MKYFTKEMWRGVNTRSKTRFKKYSNQWDHNGRLYLKQLKSLKNRLGEKNFKYFLNTSLHDGGIISFSVGQHFTDNLRKTGKSFKKPRAVQIRVLSPDKPIVYVLTYQDVKAVSFDYPTSKPLFDTNNGFGEWGYDELTLVGDYLFHEILLNTGATISVKFRNFSYRKVKASRGASI